MGSKEIVVDGSTLEVVQIAPQTASLACFHRGGEEATIWDSPETAAAMASLLPSCQCLCVQAAMQTGMGPAAFGYGFVLMPQSLPPLAHGILGVDRIQRPRLIVVVNPEARQQGIGRVITEELLGLVREHQPTAAQVEVEAENSCRGFFERSFGFEQVMGAVRTYRGNRRLYLFTKKMR